MDKLKNHPLKPYFSKIIPIFGNEIDKETLETKSMKGLSKSRYTAFCQCPKNLWAEGL